jgi:hypothetical protein
MTRVHSDAYSAHASEMPKFKAIWAKPPGQGFGANDNKTSHSLATKPECSPALLF